MLDLFDHPIQKKMKSDAPLADRMAAESQLTSFMHLQIEISRHYYKHVLHAYTCYTYLREVLPSGGNYGKYSECDSGDPQEYFTQG